MSRQFKMPSRFREAMTDDETVEFLRGESKRLAALLTDPQPGLGSWALMFGQCMQSLSDYWNQPEPQMAGDGLKKL